MFKAHSTGAIVALAGLLWLFMGLDKTTIVPFTVNDRFGDVYVDRTHVEIAMLMAISSIGATGM